MIGSREDKAERRREEFESLVNDHMDALYSTALRLTRNSLDAEDLVQDVCLRAFRFFHRFQAGTNFKAWIFKILMNTFINKYRKETREPQKVDFEKVEYFYSERHPDLGHRYVDGYREEEYQGLFGDEVKEALARLSDDFRMVVILADIEGFSYKEIAQIMACPIGTVMSRLSRARHQLQRYLNEYARKEGYVKDRNNRT